MDSKKFTYDLPDDRIARHPLAQRDHSKLLVYDRGKISHHHFFDLPQLLPAQSTLFFNNTAVIPARLYFYKKTGAKIELLLLNPAADGQPLAMAMDARHQATWKCAIGNLKRWQEGAVLVQTKNEMELKATLQHRDQGLVGLEWQPRDLTFAEMVEHFGHVPLPPYLHRQEETADKLRYQTVYALQKGAVAAPTAGLHFTEGIIQKLEEKDMKIDFLTLYVGAGTFQPIKTDNALDHSMHAEQMIVTRKNLETLLLPGRQIVAVGTTSMRTLESLYWYGVKLIRGGARVFLVNQNDPRQLGLLPLPSCKEALEAVMDTMDEEQPLIGSTSIYMVPGYSFKVCHALITNFHQPGSTLMLLVAAFAGDDWAKIYQEALDQGYRFLSYGDSSLIMP